MGMYSLKVWAGCIVFGSIIILCVESLSRGNFDDSLIGFMLWVIIFGFYFSIPAFLFFWLIAFVLQFYVKNRLIRRIIFSFTIPLLIVVTYPIILKGQVTLINWDFWTDPKIYSFVISGIVMVWLTSLPRHP